jgi:thiol-disulfide isomerase/thioredoxin
VSSQSATKNALGAGPRASARMDLSGHERDKFYLSRGGRDVVELSYLSGADGVEDARAFARADLDRDGFEDLIVVNRNAPLLRVYRNQLGPATKRHFVGVRVEGARQRDAVGARVTARGCGVTQTREVAIGAGFATVNAMALTFGLDRCQRLDELSVQFPRGERRTFKNVAADAFYRAVEGKGLQALPGVYGARTVSAATPMERGRIAELVARMPGKAPLVLVDLFASWCEACVRTRPRLDALVASARGSVDVLRVTVEPKDAGYDERAVREIDALFGGAPPLPSTLVVARRTGAVVLQTRGLPTRSDLERALWQRH